MLLLSADNAVQQHVYTRTTPSTLGVMGGCFRGGISRVDTVVHFMATTRLCTATARPLRRAADAFLTGAKRFSLAWRRAVVFPAAAAPKEFGGAPDFCVQRNYITCFSCACKLTV